MTSKDYKILPNLAECNVRVFTRFRPTKLVNESPVFEFVHKPTTIRIAGHQDFTFDRVFDTTATQAEVYEETTQTVVRDLMAGINCTVMAYGQTGSGKSYTMMGDLTRPAEQGITPRILLDLFLAIPDLATTKVECSYVEVYMEKVRDLLHPKSDNLKLRETNGSVYIEKCTVHPVKSAEELMAIIVRGEKHRSVAHTEMNARSSRSHSIFIVTVAQPNKTSKLVLVDLAGSEKVDRSGVTGQSLDEAKQINKSLSALAMVIQSLVEHKSHHIPYRNSKLTRLLTESLGGNSKTVLILAASPENNSAHETIMTLKFGNRAKRMKNTAVAHVEPVLVSTEKLTQEVLAWKQQASEWKQKFEALQKKLTIVSSLDFVEPLEWRNSFVSNSHWENNMRDVSESVMSGTESLVEDQFESPLADLVFFRIDNVVLFNADQLFLFEQFV